MQFDGAAQFFLGLVFTVVGADIDPDDVKQAADENFDRMGHRRQHGDEEADRPTDG